jgi:hypothetical protein
MSPALAIGSKLEGSRSIGLKFGDLDPKAGFWRLFFQPHSSLSSTTHLHMDLQWRLGSVSVTSEHSLCVVLELLSVHSPSRKPQGPLHSCPTFQLKDYGLAS